MTAALYHAYGLTVSSEFVFGVPVNGGDVDLSVVVLPPAELPACLPAGELLSGGGDGEHFVTALVQRPDGYLLRVRSLVDALFSSDLHTMTCTPALGVTVEHLRDLSTTMVSFLLPLKGTVALHGSCVVGEWGMTRQQGATALVGGSASGKSTLAAHLVQAGAEFVTDDLLPLVARQGEVLVTGGCAELRLRPAAVDGLARLASFKARSTVDGRTAVAVGRDRHYPLPLGLVLMPRVLEPGYGPHASRLSPRQALARLLAMGRSGSWWRSPRHVMYFDLIAAIANTVPVLDVGWSPESFQVGELVPAIEAALCG